MADALKRRIQRQAFAGLMWSKQNYIFDVDKWLDGDPGAATPPASRQNIRETARRLHLASRTVAYRLERIESLLGTSLDGDGSMRIAAALMALRVSRQAARANPGHAGGS